MLDAAWTGGVLRYEQLYSNTAAVHNFLDADAPRSRHGVRVRPVRAMGEVCTPLLVACFIPIYFLFPNTCFWLSQLLSQLAQSREFSVGRLMVLQPLSHLTN